MASRLPARALFRPVSAGYLLAGQQQHKEEPRDEVAYERTHPEDDGVLVGVDTFAVELETARQDGIEVASGQVERQYHEQTVGERDREAYSAPASLVALDHLVAE